eukprot:s1159_g8.t1
MQYLKFISDTPDGVHASDTELSPIQGAHMDWNDERDPDLWVFGQRMATMLVYLSTMPEGSGGETSFGRLGVSVQPQKGTALVWPNVDETGKPERRTIHSARHVQGDKVKYAMNIWVHGQKQPDNSWIKWHRRTPGAGEYSLPSVSFPEVVEHGGSQTGGWKYADHKAFMERLKLHKHKPTKGFFEHLYHEIPHISSVEIIDHVHWLADYMYHLAQKQWNLDTFIDEKEQLALVQQTGKLPSLEEQQQKLLMRRQEVLAEKRKRETLHGFADMEELNCSCDAECDQGARGHCSTT